LKTPIGRDFSLNSSDGVEFKVHKTMLLGGPDMLVKSIFLGGVSAQYLQSIHVVLQQKQYRTPTPTPQPSLTSHRTSSPSSSTE